MRVSWSKRLWPGLGGLPYLLLFATAAGGTTPDVVFPGDAGVVNVKTQYGAAGDGVTDDTNAIQGALNDSANGQTGVLARGNLPGQPDNLLEK